MSDERNASGSGGSGGGGEGFGQDEPTKPGIGPEDTFSLIAGALNRSVAALKEGAGLVSGLGGPSRRIALRRIGVLSHQLSDIADDFGRACMALAREEEVKERRR